MWEVPVFKVMEERCDQCLFSKDKIVSDARRTELLTECRRKDIHFICHKSKDVCCRGFFDTQTSQLMRISGRLNCIEFVPVPEPGTRPSATNKGE
jgi:hypothetical protein